MPQTKINFNSTKTESEILFFLVPLFVLRIDTFRRFSKNKQKQQLKNKLFSFDLLLSFWNASNNSLWLWLVACAYFCIIKSELNRKH